MVMGAFKQTRWAIVIRCHPARDDGDGRMGTAVRFQLGGIRLGEIQLVRRNRRLARSSSATDLESAEALKST